MTNKNVWTVNDLLYKQTKLNVIKLLILYVDTKLEV